MLRSFSLQRFMRAYQVDHVSLIRSQASKTSNEKRKQGQKKRRPPMCHEGMTHKDYDGDKS